MSNVKQTKAVVTKPSKCYVGYSTIFKMPTVDIVITTSSIADMVATTKKLIGDDFELDPSKVQKVAIFESNKITELMKYQRLE